MNTPDSFKGWRVNKDTRGYYRVWKSINKEQVTRYVGKEWDAVKAERLIDSVENNPRFKQITRQNKPAERIGTWSVKRLGNGKLRIYKKINGIFYSKDLKTEAECLVVSAFIEQAHSRLKENPGHLLVN